MKKFFMSALMAVAALSASAEQPAGGLSITPHGGLGYAISSEKIMDHFSGYVTGLVGVEATYKPVDRFGVSVGLDYGYGSTVKEETKVYDIINDPNLTHSMDADIYLTHYFVNIPVLAQVHFGQVAIKAGIQPGFIIAPEAHQDVKDKSYSSNNKIEFEDDVNTFQCTIPVGICYSPKFPLQFDLRYEIPLTNYLKDRVNDKFKLGAVMLTVGYRFDFGR